MKQTSAEFINDEMNRRGDSGVRTAKNMGMSQPGYYKAMHKGVPLRIDNFAKYCNATGYELVVVPKRFMPILSDAFIVITDGYDLDDEQNSEQ